VLGLSLRSVTLALSSFNVSVIHMTVWRDIQAQAELLKRRRQWQGIRVLGVDGAYPIFKGKKQPVVVAIDLGTGQLVAVAQIDETNPIALRGFLGPLAQRLGLSVIVNDNLHSYRKVVEKLGVEQQVCQFHVRRWVGLALRELMQTLHQEWRWVL
jgi:transposase-like protein